MKFQWLTNEFCCSSSSVYYIIIMLKRELKPVYCGVRSHLLRYLYVYMYVSGLSFTGT